MATTVTPRDVRLDGDYADAVDQADRAVGWVSFAALILALSGGWNVFEGILALARSRVYTVNATYVFSDLRTWGWIVLVLGIVELVAAFAVMSGSQAGRWFGIAAASVNAIGQLMFIQSAPFWALSMFTLDMLVIYALTVYGKRDLLEA